MIKAVTFHSRLVHQKHKVDLPRFFLLCTVDVDVCICFNKAVNFSHSLFLHLPACTSALPPSFLTFSWPATAVPNILTHLSNPVVFTLIHVVRSVTGTVVNWTNNEIFIEIVIVIWYYQLVTHVEEVLFLGSVTLLSLGNTGTGLNVEVVWLRPMSTCVYLSSAKQYFTNS